MHIDDISIQETLPRYLSGEEQQKILANLRHISNGKDMPSFYLSDYHNSFNDVILQGDGWSCLELFLPDGSKAKVKGVVLSNSCDVSPDNKRDMPARMTFAPLMKFSKLKEAFERALPAEIVQAKMEAIRGQKITSCFYFPAGGGLAEDHVVMLDNIHSFPVSDHLADANRSKIFTLNNTGFYLFIFKLSIHFCRLHENVNRTDDPVRI